MTLNQAAAFRGFVFAPSTPAGRPHAIKVVLKKRKIGVVAKRRGGTMTKLCLRRGS
jgi:hypothetical protein